MKHTYLSTSQFARAVALVIAGLAFSIVATDSEADPRRCSITPPSTDIIQGESVTFIGTWRRGDRPFSVDWTFEDGNPATAQTSGEDRSSTVSTTFIAAGSKQVTMRVTDDENESCNASVNVDVQPGGGGNNPPVADANGPYSGTVGTLVSFDGSGSNDSDGSIVTYDWDFGDGNTGTGVSPSHTYTAANTYTVSLTVTDNEGATDTATSTATIAPAGGGGNAPTGVNDSFVIDTDVVARDGAGNVPAPGVLMNDTDPDPGDTLTATLVSQASSGIVVLNTDGSFTYTPNQNAPGTDSFTYEVSDGSNTALATVELTVQTGLLVNEGKNQFNILMNYELGMHCTGFEFAYCCVLPPYNSILAQVVRTDKGNNDEDFPILLEGDPNLGKDVLARESVLRDPALDGSGNFKKYVLRYWHDAQPRNDGRGKPQSSTLISAVELNSMFMWNTIYDKTARDANGSLTTGLYNGSTDVPIGDGTPDFGGYANGWMNHLYIYADPDHPTPAGPNLEGFGNTGVDADKIHLGVDVVFPEDCGPAGHPMGPVTMDANGNTVPNDCGGLSNGNLLTFSTDTGTVVYTQMKVLEDLPIMLTSPRLWEALGLPLTPFEDSIDFFGDPGLVDEDSIRPYVQMKAALHNYDAGQPGGIGSAVMDNGQPVIGFGTAPIDIPNCERCHSNPADAVNSPNTLAGQAALVDAEYQFWNAFYDIDPLVDSDWYSRLKSAAISMLFGHDIQNGTGFTDQYGTNGADPGDPNNPGFGSPFPQNTRLGHESVICQKCHADNVIAVVKSATGPAGQLIPPVTEAIHNNHRNVTEVRDGEPGPIVFNDALGRDGGCQGCHPAHRSDGDMAGYPITLGGENFYADGDNRLASGGCFVGRDVHSNPLKDVDGAETPEHLNAVGQWLSDNVFRNQAGEFGGSADVRGIWCTNCHTQLSQEIWKAENCVDLINGDCANDVRGLPTLAAVAAAVGVDEAQAISWLDPKITNAVDDTHRIWDPAQEDANVATLEVGAAAGDCAPLDEVFNVEFGVYVCGATDVDGDFSVNILDFCTTPDCVTAAQATLTDTLAAPVPFRAATDGRDHWLSAGEPHCGDCHAAPYTEQSGNNNPFPPFNYPRKAALMRYSRGHQDITCQGCHESIHGLYPVTPTIDTTSYAQAANLNHDGSHGPLKCGACHQVNQQGTPQWHEKNNEGDFAFGNFDTAVTWAHTFTDEADPRGDVCLNCHEDENDEVAADDEHWLEHTMEGRVSRNIMDKVEILQLGAVSGSSNPRGTVCAGCHDDEWNEVSCGETEWKQHLTEGRVAHSVWEAVSIARTGTTCGW